MAQNKQRTLPKLWIVFEGYYPVGEHIGTFTNRERAQRFASRNDNWFVVPYTVYSEYENQKEYERNTPRG